MDALVKQAPYIAAIVIVVYAFLNAQSKRDSAFLQAQMDRDKIYLQAQADRDKIFLDAIQANGEIIKSLSKEVNENTQVLTAHDSSMRVIAGNIEKSTKRK